MHGQIQLAPIDPLSLFLCEMRQPLCSLKNFQLIRNEADLMSIFELADYCYEPKGILSIELRCFLI